MPNQPQKKRKSKLRAGIIRLGIMLVAILLMLSLSWVLTSVLQKGNTPVVDGTSFPTGGPSASVPPGGGEGAGQEAGSTSGGHAEQPWDFIGPAEQIPSEMAVTAADFRMISLPENGRVDLSYFNTATFLGDSLTDGFRVYKIFPDSQYCSFVGISVRAVTSGQLVKRYDGEQVVVMDEITASQPDNIYILIGANDMRMTDDAFLTYYREMLNQIKANTLEGVGIYIQTLTPVRPDNTANFDMERILSLNNMLAQLATEEDVYFLDLNEVLADEEGYLKTEYASSKDGYHMNPAGYEAWKEYLITHTAYHPRNPYLEGSPYYRAG